MCQRSQVILNLFSTGPSGLVFAEDARVGP